MDAKSWNELFAVAHYVYGESPNDFLAAMAPQIPAGPVLCIRLALHMA